MRHDINKCRVCENYLRGLETCKFCNFEWALDYPPTDDMFDILDLDDNIEWGHFQIMDRLKYKGIDCLNADIWNNDLAYIIGADAGTDRIADALGVNKDCVYDAGVMPLVVINLFQEKYLRGELE